MVNRHPRIIDVRVILQSHSVTTTRTGDHGLDIGHGLVDLRGQRQEDSVRPTSKEQC